MIPTFHPCLDQEELRAVGSVFDSRWLGMGDVTRQLERELADFLGAKHIIATSNATSALHLALAALGIEPGDEVIVPSLTFVATVQAILMAGGVPVFCEVRPETLNLDLADACARITNRTRALLPVHYAGLPCDMSPLLKETRRRGIHVVEDAAHAFGSEYQGSKVGTLGDLTCFSFDAIKNITCGQGGAVATEKDGFARNIVRQRRLGMDVAHRGAAADEANWQYHVLTSGFRYHMSDINAAIGLEQLKKFPAFQRRRREIVRRYDEAFVNVPGLELLEHNLTETCPWSYVVKISHDRRDAFREHLRQRGIATLVQFIPNHLQPAFAAHRTELPVTERLFRQIVTLPLHAELSDADVENIILAVRSFVEMPAHKTVVC